MNAAAVRVSYHGVEPSDALTQRVREEAEKLGRVFDRITSCQVVIVRPNHHHHKGSPFEVHIDIAVPRTSIVVRHRAPSRRLMAAEGKVIAPDRLRAEASPDDAYGSLADAFHAARRQLEDYARKLRGEVKAHASRANRKEKRRE